MTPNEPLPDALFEVELKEGEDRGVKLTDNLRIVAIRSGGPFDGKCLIGDQIVEVWFYRFSTNLHVIQVNGTTVSTIDEFEKFTIENGPILEINIACGLKTVSTFGPQQVKSFLSVNLNTRKLMGNQLCNGSRVNWVGSCDAIGIFEDRKQQDQRIVIDFEFFECSIKKIVNILKVQNNSARNKD